MRRKLYEREMKVRLPEALYETIEELALRQNTTMSNLVRRALRQVYQAEAESARTQVWNELEGMFHDPRGGD